VIITIDGPTASGKSAVARMLADSLNFYYLPTGWLYRSVSYLLVSEFQYSTEQLQNPLKQDVEYCLNPDFLVYTYDSKKGGDIFFREENITPFLKDYTVDQSVSLISPVVMVRENVAHAQRLFAERSYNSVIEGRDCGSVVFPHADYKFYLTAPLSVRAQRWQKDQVLRGHIFTLEQAEEQISVRDLHDLEREHSPLVIPVGAHVIDNGSMTIFETVKVLLSYTGR